MRTVRRIFIIVLLFVYNTGIHAQCNSLADLLGAFEVPPGLDTCYEISLERLENNDLALNNGLLGIDLEFAHNNLSDLLIELTSPGGQMVTLVGGITSGFPTNGSTWNVLFSECAGGAVPDPGIVSVAWDNADSWTTFTNFTGIYHPNMGCLEDFDSGSLNGIWKLRIFNSSNFETAFIDRFGFTLQDDVCVPCAASAGSQGESQLTVCSNDDLTLDLQLSGATSDPNYTLGYLIVDQNDSIIHFNLDNDFTSLEPATYNICAFSISNDDLTEFINQSYNYSVLQDEIDNGVIPYCIDLTNSCTEVTILPGPSIMVVDAEICRGGQYIVGNDIFNTEGSFSAILPAMNGDQCDTNVVLNLEVIDIEPIISSSSLGLTCASPVVTLDASTSLQENTSTWFWSTTNGLIDTDPNNISIEVSTPGTYTLRQTDGSCSLETSINVTLGSDVPQVSFNSEPISCINESTIITLNSTSTFTSASWTGPSNFTSNALEPSVSIPGIYQVLLTSDAGCEITGTYILQQGNDQPSISASAHPISCASSGVPVTVDNLGYTLYRWTGPSGFVANIAEPILPSTGTYFLEVQDENGCKGYTSLQVIGNDDGFDYEIEGEDFLCNGGRVNIRASTSIPSATYTWTGPNDYFSSSANNVVTSEGTYHVEIRANGCVVRDSITLIRDISNLPEYDIDVENLGDCENPLWRLSAIPITNEFQVSLLRWYSPALGVLAQGTEHDVNEPGRYFLLVNTFDGCQVNFFVDIDPIPSSPTVQLLSRVHVNCTNGDGMGLISVTDNPDYSYLWKGPDGFSADTSFIDSLQAGIYSLTVTDINSGCVTYLENRILADTIPRTISLQNTSINCNNPEARVIATVNGGGNTYLWTGPDGDIPTKDINVSTPGTYILEVTGGNGCLSYDTVQIVADLLPPEVNLNDQVLDCETQSVLLDPQTTENGLIFQWTGPNEFESTTAIPLVYASGQYDVTITGLNGCPAEESVLVEMNPDTPVPIATSPDTLNCIDTEIMLFGESESTVASYSWNGPSSFLSSEQNPIVSDTGEYVLTIISMEGCIGFDTVHVVEEIILPELTFAFDDQVDCINHTSSLSAISSDAGASFLWKGPNGFVSSGENATAVDTGTYTYIVRGGNNCVDSVDFQIGVEDLTISTSSLINCYQPTIDINELSDSLNYSITWTAPDGQVFNQTELIPNMNGIYVGDVIGSNGCRLLADVDISYDTLTPQAIINTEGIVRCELDEISLNNQGSSTGPEIAYDWSTNNGLILSAMDANDIDIKGVGTYLLEVLNTTNGCSDTTSVEILEAEQEFNAIEISSNNPRCFGEDNGSVLFQTGLGGTSPYTFSLDGIIFSEDSVFNNLAPGSYTFIAKDSFGCIIEEAFIIEETEALELDLGDNIDVFLGNEVEINASTNLTMEQIESIRWQIENQLGCADCLSFRITPDKDLLIALTLVNDRGCIVSDEINVRVDETPVIYKPNVFSPNDDGINDIFYVSSNPGVLMIRSFEIFDRWGEKVFNLNNFNPGDETAGWDGRIDGTPAQAGVYVYTLTVEMITGDIKRVRGDVTVIR